MSGSRSHVGVQATCRLQVTCSIESHMFGYRSHVGVQVTLWGSDNATLMGFVTGKY